MNITIELTRKDMEKLIAAEIQRRMGDVEIDASKVDIKVKSKQNYKAEWESADFKATYAVYD